jgi:tetratricopeptide (TPR) repeat protein
MSCSATTSSALSCSGASSARPEATTAELAARAATSLRAGGRRAAQRDDPASVRLLERALALTPRAHCAPVLVELAGALDGAGDLEGHATHAAAALKLSRASGDRLTAARARAAELRATFHRWKGETDLASFDAAMHTVLAELEDLGDDEGMAAVLLLLGVINVNRFEQSAAHFQGALAAAERIGDRRATTFAAGSLGLITAFGPVAAAEGIERCRTLRRRVADHPIASATLLRYEAVLHAMQGRIDEARALHADGLRAIDDLGNHWASANTAWSHSALELLGGAPERAEAAARASLELFREMGATNPGSSAAAFLAVALVRQGRHEEALRYADLAAAWAAPDDIASQVGQLGARAHALAARAELEHAEAAAREAVRLSERSDDISQRGDALVDLATVLDRAGRVSEAATALRDAIALYGRKGNLVSAARAHTTLERLEHDAAVTDASPS